MGAGRNSGTAKKIQYFNKEKVKYNTTNQTVGYNVKDYTA